MRDFRLLWAATSVSSLGTWLLVIAVPVHVYETTGSVLATSLVLAVESLPALLIGPWAGVLTDRWDRRIVLACASVTAAAGISLMFTGAIYLGLLAESIAAVFLVPASRALLPSITGMGPALANANAKMSVTSSALRMGGPVLGTLTYVHGGLTLVLILDIASYLLAALLVVSIHHRRFSQRPATAVSSKQARAAHQRTERQNREASSAQASGLLRELRIGLRYVWDTALLRGLLLASCAFWTANAGLTALLVPFLVGLGVNGSAVGYVITALGLGYLTGSVLSRWLLSLAPRPVLTLAFTSAGLCFLVMFTATSFPVTVTGAFLLGVPGAVITTVVPHTVQMSTPDTFLGRTSAAFNASDAFAALAGALLAAGLASQMSLQAVVLLFTAGTLVSGPATLLLMRPAQEKRSMTSASVRPKSVRE